MNEKIIYYQEESTDDFANTNIKTKPLRMNYRFIHNGVLWKISSFILYRIIAQPIVFLLVKLGYHQHFQNKEVLKLARKSGVYIYANHTNMLLDAYLPSLLRYRGRSYIVVGPDTMSIPGLNNIVEMLGAIPLGSTFGQKKEMIQCVRERIQQKNLIMIYPEAHIWPYYTGIRSFPSGSFGYPMDAHTPVYAMTNCYQKRRLGHRPKVVTYLDGPFYPDDTLPPVKRKEKLRDQCYNAMKKRAESNSTYSYIIYRKKENIK